LNKKLKRAVIKEELVVLTGDFVKAVLLNQFIYWSERIRDFDKFIEEERKRMEKDGQEASFEKQSGWIYKTAEELSDEAMLGLSPQTIRRHLKELMDNGWIDERQNPKYKWDRTKQYRVNIIKIQKALQEIGYSLEGYPLNFEETVQGCRSDNFGDTNLQNGESKIPKRKIKDTKMENQSKQSGGAIPETTTDTTSKTTTDITTLSSDDDTTTSYKKIVESYNDICKSLPSVRIISDKRKKKMRVMAKEFGLEDFIDVFQKAENSEFLSGKNGRWNGCNFDWLINYNNFIKVIEGTYSNRNCPVDDPSDYGW